VRGTEISHPSSSAGPGPLTLIGGNASGSVRVCDITRSFAEVSAISAEAVPIAEGQRDGVLSNTDLRRFLDASVGSISAT